MQAGIYYHHIVFDGKLRTKGLLVEFVHIIGRSSQRCQNYLQHTFAVISIIRL